MLTWDSVAAVVVVVQVAATMMFGIVPPGQRLKAVVMMKLSIQQRRMLLLATMQMTVPAGYYSNWVSVMMVSLLLLVIRCQPFAFPLLAVTVRGLLRLL
jgi:hypothetical protein